MPQALVPLALIALAAAVGAAEPGGADLAYRDDAVALRGWLARPAGDDAAPRAAVVVFPEWWGLNAYARRRARELADAGYVALAADPYGDGASVTGRAEAAALAGPLRKDRAALRRRARAAFDALAAQPGVDAARIAAIGFCFGGTCALELARDGAPLAAAVSFHGGLATDLPAASGSIRPRVLALHGGADPNVPPAEVAAFMAEMNAAGARWDLIAYGGAVHAFTNPDAGGDVSTGAAYDAEAERRSFAAMRELFAACLDRR
jgi:dienelactone hydrolase